MSTNNLPAQVTESAPVRIGFNDSQSFDLIQRVAKCLSLSTIVPKAYQGNHPNCIIALNMASRIGADPMMTMQSLYIVHGTPSWSAQFLIATFNQCGKFSSIRYDFSGQEGTDAWGCRARAVELSTGELLTGPLVTIDIAKKEGWYQKPGSKWQTMPEQMLRYRAAAWFVRTVAPEIAMGLQTAEEIHDTYDLDRQGETYLMPVRGQSSSDLNAMLHAEAPTVDAEVVPEPEQPKAEAPPEPGNGKKRPTPEELDSMRVDMVAEIEAKGIAVAEIEKMVDCYSAKWTPAHVEKIRTKLLPNLIAELMGA